MTDVNSDLYSGKDKIYFTQEMFLDVGKSLLVSILDFDGINPVTRIVRSPHETMEHALERIRMDLKL